MLAGKSRGKPVAIGTDFHVFRIEVKGNEATLFVDDEKQYSVELRDNVNTNQIRFGDLTGKADADWEIDYIRLRRDCELRSADCKLKRNFDWEERRDCGFDVDSFLRDSQ